MPIKRSKLPPPDNLGNLLGRKRLLKAFCWKAAHEDVSEIPFGEKLQKALARHKKSFRELEDRIKELEKPLSERTPRKQKPLPDPYDGIAKLEFFEA